MWKEHSKALRVKIIGEECDRHIESTRFIEEETGIESNIRLETNKIDRSKQIGERVCVYFFNVYILHTRICMYKNGSDKNPSTFQ